MKCLSLRPSLIFLSNLLTDRFLILRMWATTRLKQCPSGGGHSYPPNVSLSSATSRIAPIQVSAPRLGFLCLGGYRVPFFAFGWRSASALR